MSPVLEAVASYFLPCILITLLPGPDTMVVLQSSVGGGRRDGLRAALGVSAGLIVWSVVVGLGLGLILATDAIALLLFKVICCTYLVYLSWQAMLASRRQVGAGLPPQPVTRPLMKALGTCALNPKLGAFFVAVLPQFIPDDAPSGVTASVLVLVQSGVALVWFTFVTIAAARMASILRRPKSLAWLNRISAGVFVIFAVRLVIE